ncbi:MFS transporter [Candidatus Heimdallarchaeota archaeon]|nr:MAG: MFS transporter [Candidatus Heimdallarchaeota archaeon]
MSIDTELGPPTEAEVNILDVLRNPETKEVFAFLLSQFFAFAIYMSIRQLFPLYLMEAESSKLMNFSRMDYLVSFSPIGLEEFSRSVQLIVVAKWGIIATAYTFAGLFGRIPSGWLIEKIGRRKTIIISFILMIISVGCLALTDITGILALLFAILRLTNNTFGLASRSLLSDLKSKHKGLFNSLISSSGRLGTLVGSLSLGFVLDIFPGYVMILSGFALSIIGTGAFLLLFVKGKAEAMHFIRRVDIKKGKKEKLDLKIFKSKTFIFFTLSFIVFGIISGITDPILAIYGDELNLNESSIGMILGLSQLSFILLSPLIGWIISSKPKVIDGLLITSAVIIIINYLLIYLIPYSVAIYTVILFGKNLAHALFFPVVFTILTYELPKAHFSVIYSILTTGFFLGITGTAYLSTYLYTISTSLPWLFAVIAAVVLTITVVIYTLVKKEKNVQTA